MPPASADAPEVEQVVICTPDKDLAQCVRGTRVVMLDRRRRITLDEDGVKAKFGVPPESMPDWLALVGDSSDGYPGLPGWGPKTAAALLTRYRRLEDIPSLEEGWGVSVRGAGGAGQVLRDKRAEALLYRQLAAPAHGRAADGDPRRPALAGRAAGRAGSGLRGDRRERHRRAHAPVAGVVAYNPRVPRPA